MKKSVRKRVGRPPGRKAARRPVIATRVPLPFYETIKQVAQISGRTLSEELIWRTTQALEARDIVEDARKEARELLADARHVKEEAVLAELARTHTQIVGSSGPYWIPKGAKPLQFGVGPEFQAAIDDAVDKSVKKAFAAAKGKPK